MIVTKLAQVRPHCFQHVFFFGAYFVFVICQHLTLPVTILPICLLATQCNSTLNKIKKYSKSFVGKMFALEKRSALLNGV